MAGVSRNHVEVKVGSAKIKHGILFYIAPAPPSRFPINNDQSLISRIIYKSAQIILCNLN